MFYLRPNRPNRPKVAVFRGFWAGQRRLRSMSGVWSKAVVNRSNLDIVVRMSGIRSKLTVE